MITMKVNSLTSLIIKEFHAREKWPKSIGLAMKGVISIMNTFVVNNAIGLAELVFALNLQKI